MRPLILILVFSVLAVADAYSTVLLNERFPAGTELNPYISPHNLVSILFAPMKVLIYGIFLAAVWHSEKNQKQLEDWRDPLSNRVMVAYVPLFLIAVKTLAIINNLMPFLGYSTPVSYLLMWMDYLPGSRSTHYALIWSAIFLLLAPAGVKIVRRMYRH